MFAERLSSIADREFSTMSIDEKCEKRVPEELVAILGNQQSNDDAITNVLNEASFKAFVNKPRRKPVKSVVSSAKPPINRQAASLKPTADSETAWHPKDHTQPKSGLTTGTTETDTEYMD